MEDINTIKFSLADENILNDVDKIKEMCGLDMNLNALKNICDKLLEDYDPESVNVLFSFIYNNCAETYNIIVENILNIINVTIDDNNIELERYISDLKNNK